MRGFENLLIICIVLTAHGISSTSKIGRTMSWYRIQGALLATLYFSLFFNNPTPNFARLFAGLLLGILTYYLIPVLAQTKAGVSHSERLKPLFWGQQFHPKYQRYPPHWKDRTGLRLPIALTFFVNILLTLAAFAAANSLSKAIGHGSAFWLASVLILVFLGLFTMFNCTDLKSQIVGLLVMDHAMFLGCTQLDEKVLCWSFVIGLLFYLLLTLTLLMLILPTLVAFSDSVLLEDQKQLKG